MLNFLSGGQTGIQHDIYEAYYRFIILLFNGTSVYGIKKPPIHQLKMEGFNLTIYHYSMN